MPAQQHDHAFSVVIDRPGRTTTRPITPIANSVRWSSAAVGGFGACSFTVPYAQLDQFPHLARAQLYDGDTLLWEGRIEDRAIHMTGEDRSVAISCFGYQRLLQDTSVRRIWELRSIPWRPAWHVSGLATVLGFTVTLHTDQLFVTTGQFDPGDLTRIGIEIRNNTGTASSLGAANWAVYVAPEGITLETTLALATGGGSFATWFAQDSTAGSSWTELDDGQGTENVTLTHSANARYLLLGLGAATTQAEGTWENIRILCTSLTEDVTGGFYGGTLMRDLLALVPGLAVGFIDDGLDFTIQSLARPVRDAVVSVVGEIASYYDREWGVWEDRTFTWQDVDLDAPQWIVGLADCSELELDSSIQGLTKTAYIVYENAATGEAEEQSTEATDPRNPYVRIGDTGDRVLSAPVVMTALSAQKLADRVAQLSGDFPAVRGRVAIPAGQQIRNVVSGLMPASRIRGGENISIPELPQDDWIRPGRDGQTLFHVSAVECSMDDGTVSVEFESYSRRADVLLARLAAVTRTITG